MATTVLSAECLLCSGYRGQHIAYTVSFKPRNTPPLFGEEEGKDPWWQCDCFTHGGNEAERGLVQGLTANKQ